jgi:hypothetical protein
MRTKSTTATTFALGASLAALCGALVVLALSAHRTGVERAWMVAGWAIVSIAGALGGAWLEREHGKPGTGFLLALGTGVAARFFAVAVGSVVAALSGRRNLIAYAFGLAAGFVPVQLYEAVWFLRKTRRTAA